MKILVTGGCGFIGSNFIKYLFTSPEISEDLTVINLDKLSYAGQGKNLEYMSLDSHKNYTFAEGDICNQGLVEKLFAEHEPDLVFNFAAESHVDRSIESGDPFVRTNVIGTKVLLDTARKRKVKKFVQISTDEVYGSLDKGSFSEDARLDPSSDYSASKASADLFAIATFKTYGFPVLITRSANNYGPYQFPEKFIPRSITELIEGRNIPLMWSSNNPGLNVRDWLHVDDNCRAIWFVSQHGNPGDIYNIPGENERTNIEIARMILKSFGLGENRIQKITHRQGHDFRYSISGTKLSGIGFQYKHKDLETELGKLCKWYQSNPEWWKGLKKLAEGFKK